jgi:hypothetical protein
LPIWDDFALEHIVTFMPQQRLLYHSIYFYQHWLFRNVILSSGLVLENKDGKNSGVDSCKFEGI